MRRKADIRKICINIVLFLSVLCTFLLLGYPFFKFIVYAGDKKVRNKRKWFGLKHAQINHPRNGYEAKYEEGRAWCQLSYESGVMKDRYIISDDGLRLHACYLPADKPKRILLLSHGYRGSGFGDFANMARFLHENGCDLLFIDQRCCGLSEGKYITFGAREHRDILKWVRQLDENNKNDLPIYLYGESMGAATILMASGHELPGNVKGLICDCGFCSMKQQLRDIAKEWFHIKWIELLLLRVDLFCRLFAGFKMSDADTKEALSKCRIPILFFHGSDDTYVKAHNSVKNYEMCRSGKDLMIVRGARHMCSPYVEEKEYRGRITEFFKAND